MGGGVGVIVGGFCECCDGGTLIANEANNAGGYFARDNGLVVFPDDGYTGKKIR